MFLHQTCFPRAGKQTSRRPVVLRRSSPRFSCPGSAEGSDPSLPVESTSCTVNRIAGSAPRRWTRHRYRLASGIVLLFFESPLNLRITAGDRWARFAQAKPKLTEHPLTLPGAKGDAEFFSMKADSDLPSHTPGASPTSSGRTRSAA